MASFRTPVVTTSTAVASEREAVSPSPSPRDAAEPEFHRPPARKYEPWLVRLNRFCVRAWLFTVASVFDLLTWPAKTVGLAVLPESVKFYVYMWWMTWSMLFIWGLTICEKLVLKLRAPRRTDVTAPLQAIANSFFSKVFPTFGYDDRSRARSGSGSFCSASNVAGGDADGPGNDCPFVMVHGMAGWGRGTEWLPSYWGGAESMDRITFTPRLGPMSSQHHRACELFAQLKGGTVDYGEEISHRLGHDRYGRTCVDAVFSFIFIHALGWGWVGWLVKCRGQACLRNRRPASACCVLLAASSSSLLLRRA
jgi:hypothetical protein